jgi:hypothetical protein
VLLSVVRWVYTSSPSRGPASRACARPRCPSSSAWWTTAPRGTEAYSAASPCPTRCVTSQRETWGLIRALNAARAGGPASSSASCTTTRDARAAWLARLRDAVTGGERWGWPAYGARRLRADGALTRQDHRVRAWKARPRRPPRDRGGGGGRRLLFLPARCWDQVGGFDEGYGFFHGYDRELSVRGAVAVRAGWCTPPFSHRGGGTRTGWGRRAGPPRIWPSAAPLAHRFAARWRHRCRRRAPLRARLADRLRRSS